MYGLVSRWGRVWASRGAVAGFLLSSLGQVPPGDCGHRSWNTVKGEISTAVEEIERLYCYCCYCYYHYYYHYYSYSYYYYM